MANRVDTVFIRKSTDAQDEQAQINNVKGGLARFGKHVPEKYWFVETVSRRKVHKNTEFLRLINMVETDQISVVYVESQTRWGTDGLDQLFFFIRILREHGTQLFDLRDNRNIASEDFADEILTVINSLTSKRELRDLAKNSLRTRVFDFPLKRSWPTGAQPFGYAKECRSPDGTLKWVWQPNSRVRGQVFYPRADGKFEPGPIGKISRKSKEDLIRLVPSGNSQYVAAVKRVFELYANVGLSRRQISLRLNNEGLTYYSEQFTHSLVTQILTNPAYVGDTHFGKVKAGELCTFKRDGDQIILLELEREDQAPRKRPESERIVQMNTHEGLIDRDTWERTKAKLESEKARTSYSPRKAAYYLKQIFVCGHCGKNLAGRTEIHPTTKEKTVVYICSTYMQGRSNGQTVSCRAYRITHEQAERMLWEKVEEQNLQFDAIASESARTNIQNQLAAIDAVGSEAVERLEQLENEGIEGLMRFFKHEYDLTSAEMKRLRRIATRHFSGAELNAARDFADVPLGWGEFRQAIGEVEAKAIQRAGAKLRRLEKEHADATIALVVAPPLAKDRIVDMLKDLEVQIAEAKAKQTPLSERLREMWSDEALRYDERRKLLREWPALEDREKGEALRRLFDTVTLYWDATFHPASPNPQQPRKTQRLGRYSYKIDENRTEWKINPSNLVGTW